MKIYEKIAAVQGELSNPPAKTENPYYKSKYAALPDILDLIRPVLAKHGIALIQYPETTKEEDGSLLLSIRTKLAMTVGDVDEVLDCGAMSIQAAGMNAQQVGAVITYYRRYAIKALFAIEAEDDDANVAVPEPKGGVKKQSAPSPAKNEQAHGDVKAIKAAFLASKSAAEQDAVVAGANGFAWTDAEYQELEIFFDTELSKRADIQGGKK